MNIIDASGEVSSRPESEIEMRIKLTSLRKNQLLMQNIKERSFLESQKRVP